MVYTFLDQRTSARAEVGWWRRDILLSAPPYPSARSMPTCCASAQFDLRHRRGWRTSQDSHRITRRNPNIRPSCAKLDGELIAMPLVSGIQIRAENAYRFVTRIRHAASPRWQPFRSGRTICVFIRQRANLPSAATIPNLLLRLATFLAIWRAFSLRESRCT